MKLSVITVNYNHRDGLEKTILSVIGQKEFDDYEYIIIDGGSTDGSRAVIEKYASHIDYWVSEPDAGIYNAMNKAIKVAKGDYCIFMNSGDCFYDKTVLKNVFVKRNAQADCIAGDYCINKVVKKAPEKVTAMTLFKVFDRSICHQALFMKRELLLSYPFQEEYTIVADFVSQFQNLIFENVHYQYINVIICDLEPDGLSSVNYKRLAVEKTQYLQSALPARVYDDYITFSNIKFILYNYDELYRQLGKYNFSKTDLKLATTVLKIAGFIKRTKQSIRSLIDSCLR